MEADVVLGVEIDLLEEMQLFFEDVQTPAFEEDEIDLGIWGSGTSYSSA